MSARSYLRRFLFADERVNERVDRLSGGERARLMLAKVLQRGGNVVVLDEPTNDLDLPSLRLLEEALADFDGSVLVVSHDRFFWIASATRSWPSKTAAFSCSRAISPITWRSAKNGNCARSSRGEASPKLTRASRRPQRPSPAAPRKLTFKEQRELADMERAILAVEAQVAELETILNDPGFYITRSREAAGLIADLEAGKADVARLYERWHELDQIGK